MKRVYALILTVLLVCLGVCTAQAAARMEDGFCFDVENGGAVVISYAFDNENPKKSLVIPKELGGYPVRAIGYSAFDGCWWLEDVTLPDTLRKISQYAFSGCYNLTDVNIPYGVTLIGKGAFMNCCNMESVILPDSLVQLEGHAFQYCSNLKEITIPAGVERVTNYTFGGCYGINKINVKGRDTQFYRWAFCSDGDIEGFEQALDADRVIFTCWPGQTKTSRAYSPEMYAVKTGIRNIRYYQVENENELPDEPVTVPAVILGQIDQGANEKEVVLTVKPFETEKPNSMAFEIDLIYVEDGSKVEINGGTKLYLPFPPDMDYEACRKMDFTIRHDAHDGTYWYSTLDNSIKITKKGLCISISSFSPFYIEWMEKLPAGALPETGDRSRIVLWLALLTLAGAAMLTRKRKAV